MKLHADTLASFDDFLALDIRVGTILEALDFPKARKRAYRLKIDFGSLGIKKSSAQITDLYQPENLIGKKVIAVVNFPPRQVADFISEVLILGSSDSQGRVLLIHPDIAAENGDKIA